MRILSGIIIFLLFSNPLLAQDSSLFWLDKNSIIQEAKRNSPTINRIRSSLLSKKLDKNQYLENFQTRLEGDVSYFKSNEDSFIEFSPTVSPVNNFSLGVAKDFTTGMSFGVFNNHYKRDYQTYGVDSRNSISLEFTMDLYKDFFGSTSKSKISYLNYEEQAAQIQKDIDKEIFLITLVRIYFDIILNQEAINVSRDILEIYKKQELNTKKRYKNGIADLSEVKRRSSQLASKRVDIFNLVNRQENLILDLKKLLPSIANKEIKLLDYNIDELEEYFSTITSNIRSKDKVPMDYTYYDDLVKLVEKSYHAQKKFTKNYSDIDLEFYSQFNHFGKDDSSRGAVDNNFGNAADSYEVGLRLKAPIGRTKTNSKSLQLSINQANYLATKKENLAKIAAYHTQSIKNLELLRKSSIYQSENSKDLQQILRLSQRKFRQARIPIKDLIEDQNLYLQSILRELEIKMVVINQILDYMAVFTNTPFALSNKNNEE